MTRDVLAPCIGCTTDCPFLKLCVENQGEITIPLGKRMEPVRVVFDEPYDIGPDDVMDDEGTYVTDFDAEATWFFATVVGILAILIGLAFGIVIGASWPELFSRR